jgi:type 1 glutamine amidotransferase
MPENRDRLDCVLVAGGKFHDINFARLELLKLLAEDERVSVRVFEDYSNREAISSAHFLVSYTCDVVPGLAEQEMLRTFVARGGRWYALHGTNSILRFLKSGQVDSPDWAPHFMQTLGSMFIAHPPISPYRVAMADSNHPLTAGLAPFDATDELYLLRTYGGLQVLLETEYEGEAQGFVEAKWQRAKHPVWYLNHIGKGAVLYLTLGHCRGHFDMRPLMDWYPQVERGSWELPVFYELLRRGISWAKQRGENQT